MNASWKPSKTAAVVFEDSEIIIWSDGTWKPKTDPHGWTAHADAVVYASGTGDARITTEATGRSKISKVTSPAGTVYDVRALAAAGA